LEETDLTFNGFGRPWGVTRSYGNVFEKDYNGEVGINWWVNQNPYLIAGGAGSLPDSIQVVFSPSTQLLFRKQTPSNDYAPAFGTRSTLRWDGTNSEFIFVDTLGRQLVFNAFTGTTSGKLKAALDSGGSRIDAAYNSNGTLQRFARNDGTTPAPLWTGFSYNYNSDDATKVDSIELSIEGDSIRRSSYEYYGDFDPYGLEWNLKKVVVEEFVDATWQEITTSYYRYYKNNTATGFKNGLRFVVGPEAFRRLLAAGLDPLEASDLQITPYADFYFEYDSSRRVSFERLDGGAKQYGFEYYANPSSVNDVNAWTLRTTENFLDGSRVVAYSNRNKQVIFKVYISEDGTQRWYEGYKLDPKGRVIERAESSAISNYSESIPSLAILYPSSGLIRKSVFYGASDPDGQPEGYLKAEYVQNGSGGTPIKLKDYTYLLRDAVLGQRYVVAEETTYQETSGGGAPSIKSYSYEWYEDSLQYSLRVTALPVIPTSQNGDGTIYTLSEVYDSTGRLSWVKNQRGFLTAYTVDAITGGATSEIEDVDTSLMPAPYGWTTPSGGGKHLVTDYLLDVFGRRTQSLGPEHSIVIDGDSTSIRRAGWIVYKDSLHQEWSAGGYQRVDDATFTLVNPVTITQKDRGGRRIGWINASRESESGKLDSTDVFDDQSQWTRWKTSVYDNGSRLVAERVYFDIPPAGEGLLNINYYQSDYGYDPLGRKIRERGFGGTITRYVLNPKGWIIETWVGTNDTNATERDPSGAGAYGNNMSKVSTQEFDGNSSGGNGYLTKSTKYVSSTETRETSYQNDFRGRSLETFGEEGFYEGQTYDNLDRITKVEQRVLSSTGRLLARWEPAFDNQGRLFKTLLSSVDPTTGNVTGHLTKLSWFDPSGNLIKNQEINGNGFKKWTIDSVGRVTAKYVACFPGTDGGDDPDSVEEDWVLEQVDLEYDAAGNGVSQITAERNHDATGTGRLNAPGGTQPKARISYKYFFVDALGRQIATVDYGTNGGSAPTPPTIIPASSAAVLVSLSFYSNRGDLYKTIDPAGVIDLAIYDDASRLIQTTKNSCPEIVSSDSNRITLLGYNADGNLIELLVANANTGNQITHWEYGVDKPDSGVASNLLLKAKVTPNGKKISYSFSRQGEVLTATDDNGTVHSYDYDGLGRRIQDRVTTLGLGINGAVRRISYSYNALGVVENISSWNSAVVDSGSLINQVLKTFNGFGQLAIEQQSISGGVGAGTPTIVYSYEVSNNSSRRVQIMYPNGRFIGYSYGSTGSIDDLTNRISVITDSEIGAQPVARYSRRGINSTVIIEYPEAGSELTYLGTPGDGGDQYAGLDRFNRIIDIYWKRIVGGGDLARFKYNFDRAGNRLVRQDVMGASLGFDETYGYDGLNQLGVQKRGNLVDGVIVGVPKGQEKFQYDPIGNWNSFTVEANGSVNLNQTRSHNTDNEISAIDGSSVPVGYDENGNMAIVPKTTDWGARWGLVWDAWNRLISVSDGGGLSESYAYDGLMRRTLSTLPNGFIRGFAYSDGWQIIEERVGFDNLPEVADRQYIWGLRYSDDLVLRDVFDGSSGGSSGSGAVDRLYALHDQWSVVAVTDRYGSVAERYCYSPFGNVQVLTPGYVPKIVSGYDWNIGYGAYRRDNTTGFYNVRFRYLHPNLGRWISKDPIEEAGGFNLFAYVLNNPPNGADPFGLHCKDCEQEYEDCMQRARDDRDDRTSDAFSDLQSRLKALTAEAQRQFMTLSNQASALRDAATSKCSDNPVLYMACFAGAWYVWAQTDARILAAYSAATAVIAAWAASFTAGQLAAIGLIYTHEVGDCKRAREHCKDGYGKQDNGCPCP
jgi:RHS repeat-associated protein